MTLIDTAKHPDYTRLSTKEVGRLGEDLACEYLAAQGLRILERNYRARVGEVDIIALDHGSLAFIEVKTRRTHARGTGLAAITPRKLATIRTLVGHYLVDHAPLHTSVRIDAFDILLQSGSAPVFTHLKGVH